MSRITKSEVKQEPRQNRRSGLFLVLFPIAAVLLLIAFLTILR